MGRLEDIAARNKNPRKHREGRIPYGIIISCFVLLILILVIFTDLGISPMPKGLGSGAGSADGSAMPLEKGRVRDIGLYVEHTHRDAGTPSPD
jgi:hypothetical protein